MSQENVEIVRGVYARWSEGDFRASMEVLDPLVLFVHPPSLPEPGAYLGVDQVREFMRGFLESWSPLTIEAEDITQADGGTVVATVRQSGVGSGSGAKTDLRYSQVWSFRGGKVIRLENFREHAEALEAAGLRE
jgi:ketosteroid isomerase-like protein